MPIVTPLTMNELHTPIAPGARGGARQRRGQGGMTLIEVMVALLVFSVGLLGLVALQARATQYSIGAEDASRAALLANEIAATMWTQRSVDLDADVLDAWDARVADTAGGGLPNGTGTVAVAGGVATVTVSWRPVGAVDASEHRYQTQVVIP
jgi:type IV pilus assembly protein PilV